ncbi:MAG: hypothetical protein ACK5K7_03180 [Bacilli bacterium]
MMVWPKKNLYPYGKLPLGIERDNNKKLIYNNDIKIVKYLYNSYVNKNMTVLQIEQEIKTKYPFFKIKLHKGYLTRLLSNTLYRGFFQRETLNGELLKVQVIDPIFVDEDIEKMNHTNQRYKIKSKHFYSLQNKVHFEDGTKMNHCKQYKELANGEIATYKYYYSKKEKMYINENRILSSLKNAIKNNLDARQSSVENKINELDELLLGNHISLEHYKKLKSKLDKSCNIKNQFKQIIITKEGHINVVF